MMRCSDAGQFSSETIYLVWCISMPESLDVVKSNTYFFLKGWICISGLKEPQLYSELSVSDILQCTLGWLNDFSKNRVVCP